MKTSLRYREVIPDARRVVVKIGTRVLVQKTGRPDVRRMKGLAAEIAAMQKTSREVALVSSGAIGAGMEALGMKTRPEKLPDQQMAAAVGQTRLMSRYAEIFSSLKCIVGQVLLTHADFRQKIQITNARRTLERLLRAGVIPIINENDVVADEEIRAVQSLGDNDKLAAKVVGLVRADLLIMLTTVDGVREPAAGGRHRRISYIERVTPRTFRMVTDEKSPLAKGGMATKLRAARDAARTGCSVVIANGRQSGVLTRIMKGEDVGTLVLAEGV